MFAIINTGGKQIKVEKGQTIYVEKLVGEAGDNVVFDKVVMVGDKVGTPLVSGATVSGKIQKQGKQKKLKIMRYRPKTNVHKLTGHRQPYTSVLIEDIKG